jgi:hypothetical protein
VEVLKFNLYLQIRYFSLHNQQIKQESDDPESYAVKDVLRSNERVIVSNFNLYLDYVNNEVSFSEEAIQQFAEGIDLYFQELIKTFPSADFNPTKTKATAMLKKSQSDVLKASLTGLLEKIEKHTAATIVHAQ